MTNSVVVQEFIELVQIDVQSRNERAIADVLKQKLATIGLEVTEDDAAAKVGGNAGNIIARLPGSAAIPAILLSAHMDRVANTGGIKPVVHEDENLITSDGSSILAADNISGVCAILSGLRKLKADGIPHGDIEVAFSVCEEIGVVGAKHLDFSRFKAKIAYVFDAPGRLGRIITQAPTKCKVKVGVHGRSAHAGNEPEKGLSAIRVAASALTRLREGRISSNTTSNFGAFHAGSSTNVVCDYAELQGEVRSTDDRELEQYLQEMKDVFTTVANECATPIDVDVQMLYRTFSVTPSAQIAQIAARAMKNLGVEANFTAGGGGMDGNHFNANGIQAIGIALGYSKNHTPEEQIVISDMVKCSELICELVKEVYLSAGK